jgi:hypothetical protein
MGEQKVLDLMTSQGATPEVAAENMRMAAQKGYRELAVWFANADDVEQLASTLRDSVILPVFFWCSLAFMPFVIMLTSFDQLSTDLNARSICYSILRARRSEILLGKAVAHTVVFMVLTAVASAILVLVASLLLETVDFGDAGLGLVRVWILLIPFGLCYLGISSFCSAANTQPVPALLSAIAIIVALRIIGWLRYVPEESSWGFLQHARWVSPATYQDGLWRAGFTDPALSAGAYMAFGAVFIVFGILVLRARDL